MKKILLIAILAMGVLSIACDKQKALDNMMADPEIKSYFLNQMLSDEATRAELADSIFADDQITTAYLDNMAMDENSRAMMLEYILKADSTGEWITGRLAENPDMKQAMRKASRL